MSHLPGKSHHNRPENKQINRENPHPRGLSQNTKDRRHQHNSQIGQGHLDAHHGLGDLRAEVFRRQIVKVRKQWTVPQSDQKYARSGRGGGQRQKQQDNRRSQDPLAYADNLPL